MTEAQKYNKKKNLLIIAFMFLLVIFVGLICFIFIYVKMHPKKEYVSPDTIPIITMQEKDYQPNINNEIYTELTTSTDFKVLELSKEVVLMVNENKEVINSETQNKLEILLNNTNINENIKMIYQGKGENLILTEDGKMYRLLSDSIQEANKVNVGQILANMTVKNIVNMNVATDDVYVLTEDAKIININTQEEYDGIIKHLETSGGTLYVYNDYSVTFEKGKKLVNENGQSVKFNIMFNNKLIDENAVIYDVDFANRTLKTSNLGTMVKASYSRKEDQTYSIGLEANTGIYTFDSEYYYTR